MLLKGNICKVKSCHNTEKEHGGIVAQTQKLIEADRKASKLQQKRKGTWNNLPPKRCKFLSMMQGLSSATALWPSYVWVPLPDPSLRKNLHFAGSLEKLPAEATNFHCSRCWGFVIIRAPFLFAGIAVPVKCCWSGFFFYLLLGKTPFARDCKIYS